MKEIKFTYKYVIKSKKRPEVNFGTRAIRNPSKDDEHAIAHDTKRQLSKAKEKEIFASKYVSFEIRNYYRTTRRNLWGTPKLTAPDVDNCMKLWSDALTGILWEDDNKIYKMKGSKWWADKAYSEVIVKYGGSYDD